MAGELDVIEAEGGHERGVVRGEEVRVVAQAGVGGRDALGVVVGGVGGGAVGIVDERALELVGNDAEIVVVHLNESVDAGFIADAVGRGARNLAVGDQAHLVSAGDDPLRVGGGEVGGEEQHARADAGGVDHLAGRVLRGELDGMRPSRSFGDPLGLPSQQGSNCR
jgi:hypothetical protein